MTSSQRAGSDGYGSPPLGTLRWRDSSRQSVGWYTYFYWLNRRGGPRRRSV